MGTALDLKLPEQSPDNIRPLGDIIYHNLVKNDWLYADLARKTGLSKATIHRLVTNSDNRGNTYHTTITLAMPPQPLLWMFTAMSQTKCRRSVQSEWRPISRAFWSYKGKCKGKSKNTSRHSQLLTHKSAKKQRRNPVRKFVLTGFCWRSERDLLHFRYAKTKVRLRRAVAGNSPPDCCI